MAPQSRYYQLRVEKENLLHRKSWYFKLWLEEQAGLGHMQVGVERPGQRQESLSMCISQRQRR